MVTSGSSREPKSIRFSESGDPSAVDVCANRWITNGTFADYFTVACKTEGGYTVILVPRCDGLSTKPIKTAYSPTAGTAFVTFDKVRVPVSNTLGKEGKGMSVILSNFNHERWLILAMSLSTQRLIVEESLKYVAFWTLVPDRRCSRAGGRTSAKRSENR
jgi:alkylation response protein AidB-like acyl-CoA dehydrogenase